MNTINKVIATATSLAILALVFAASISQAQTSCSTAAYDNRTDASDAELNLDGAGTDYEVASTNARLSKIIAGFEFLRKIDKGVIKEFDKAWRASADGTNGREVLMFRMEDGSYTGRSQGFTNQDRGFTFKWNPAALAIVHTHPNSCDPRPSPQDQRVAEKYDGRAAHVKVRVEDRVSQSELIPRFCESHRQTDKCLSTRRERAVE